MCPPVCRFVVIRRPPPSIPALSLHDALPISLFILIGARPHTDWRPEVVERDKWGFLPTGVDLAREEGRSLERPVVMYETNVPGLFAVGDVRHRSVKRVASAVGEGSVVIQQVQE